MLTVESLRDKLKGVEEDFEKTREQLIRLDTATAVLKQIIAEFEKPADTEEPTAAVEQ